VRSAAVEDVPALDQLMGAYFHQDWDMDGDEWDVLALFITDEPELASRIPADVEHTLATYPGEPELKAFIEVELGGCFAADADGGTYRQWLTQIAERVRTATT
jgi:hypothetical protein